MQKLMTTMKERDELEKKLNDKTKSIAHLTKINEAVLAAFVEAEDNFYSCLD